MESDAKLDTYREARAAVGDRLKELIESADQPSVVADPVLNAAVAARSKLRYPAGGRPSFLQLLRRFAPATLVDEGSRKNLRLAAPAALLPRTPAFEKA